MTSLREELDFKLGELYNDYKILKKYPSANDLIDAMVEITLKEFKKLIDERMEKMKTIVIALSGAKVWELIEPCYEDLKEELEK